MARRGGRRGRRSRSKQRSRGAGSRSSKAKSSKSRSRNTRGSGARKSAPSKRRSAPKASNRRATASKARRAAPKKSTPKKKAPTRRAPTKKNVRGSGVSPQKKQAAKTVKKVVSKVTKPQAAAAATKKTTPKKTTPTPSAQKTMREKAAARHAQFKKTGVQTYGGTRNVNSYTKKELDKLQSYARTEGKSFGMTIGQPGVKYPGKTGMEKLSADQVPNADGLVMNSVGQFVTPEQLAKDDADAGPSIGRSIAKGINTIKNNVVPFGRRIPDLKTDYTVAQEARLKATTPYKTGQRTKTGAIAGRGSSDNRMQIQQPAPPTRESVEQLAAMSDSLPPDSIRDTPAPETTTPTPNAVVQQERFIDVGGGKQISANNMADYLASLRSTWDQQSQQYQSQIGQLQGQIGGYETQVGGLQGQIGTLQGQVGDYQGQIGGLQSDIGGYKTASERQQQLLDQYQMQIGGLQSDISGYRGRVSDYEKSLGDYRTQVGGLRRDIGDYKTQISGLQSDIGGYRSQIGGLQSDIGGYKSQIGGLQADIGGLQSDIGGYKGQIGQLQGDIKGYQGEISGLRGDVLGLRGDISNYQARERKAQEMQIRDAQRQRVAQSYGLGKKKPKVGGVKTGRIEEEARMYGPRATFNRSGLRISSLNI